MEEKLRILILEDVDADAELMERELRRSKIEFSSRQVKTKEGFLKELKDFLPDIVLADYKLPQFDGLYALQLLKEQTLSIPLVIVTGSMDEETAVDCIKLGATDYVIKEHLVRLGPAVKGALEKKGMIEEKLHVEEELRRTNEFLKNILESSSHISIISTDIERNILYWNIGAENIFGYKAEEMVGRCKIDILYKEEEDTKETIERARVYVFKNKKGTSCQVVEVTKDGRRLWINITLTPRFDGKGRVIGILGIGEDITKKKRAEEALKESGEHARVFASYQYVISQLRQFYVREASFEQMLQRTVDLLVKSFGYCMAWYGELKADKKIIIPKVWAGKYERYLDGLQLKLDDSKDAKCAMSLTIVKKEPFGYADLEHDKDFEKWRPLALKYGYRSNQAMPLIIGGKSIGAFLIYSTRPYTFSKILIQYLAGIASELATIVEEITEQKKQREKIKHTAEEWKKTFDAISDLVFIQDKDFTITRVNKAFADALKSKPEDIVGKKCYELFHKSDKPWPNCPFEMTKKDKKSNTQEVDDPNIGIPLLITTSPIFDDKGGLIGSVHIAKDISEIRKAKKEFEKKIKDLERFHKVTVGREMEMVKLKDKINSLLEKLGQPKKYEAPEKIKEK